MWGWIYYFSFIWSKQRSVENTLNDGPQIRFTVITKRNTLVVYRITRDQQRVEQEESYSLTEALAGIGKAHIDPTLPKKFMVFNSMVMIIQSQVLASTITNFCKCFASVTFIEHAPGWNTESRDLRWLNLNEHVHMIKYLCIYWNPTQCYSFTWSYAD